jgi:hypothetical protein
MINDQIGSSAAMYVAPFFYSNKNEFDAYIENSLVGGGMGVINANLNKDGSPTKGSILADRSMASA